MNEAINKLEDHNEEFRKCIDSPVYFYNKYIRKEDQKEITESEYNDFLKLVEQQRNVPLKMRQKYKDYPLLPDQCFNPTPPLC